MPASTPLDMDPEKVSEINVLKTNLHGKFTQQAGPDGPKQEEMKQSHPGYREQMPTAYRDMTKMSAGAGCEQAYVSGNPSSAGTLAGQRFYRIFIRVRGEYEQVEQARLP
ncbi:hypothetical protein [Microbulbifer donghaiensis]|uniref:hypothetical protein n=1 Tax=Microbulbifer donghaiensis TaxID=494016 RepID=UPI001F2102D9|nr:hypothetical protein [Microbulbifer donghaiensis]